MNKEEEPKPAPSGSTARAALRAAIRADEKARDEERFGPASEGRRLDAWRCACGWSGGVKELAPSPAGVACPACGGTPEAA
ncbi:MAG TPA: hypothetical protein VM434_09190 [Beijerinckiaceae bacterium]|nr:hypothetical protein [Beijerinckiaceae bacterium]